MNPQPRIPNPERVARELSRLGEGIASVWERFVGPLDRALGTLLGRSLEATEQFERIEPILENAALRALTPLRRLFGFAAAWIPVPLRNFIGAVGERFAAFCHRILGVLLWLAEWLNLDVVFRWVARLTWPVWRPVAGVIGFVHAWLITRERRQMLYGLPAIALVLPFALLAYRAVTKGLEIAPTYRLAIDTATQEKDYEVLRLYERKLEQLGFDTKLNTYNRAAALAADGKFDEAYQLMQRLAPVDQPGYARAHFWIVEKLLAEKLDFTSEERHHQIEQHLVQLEALGVRGPGLTLLRASRLIADNQLAEAAELVRPLAPDVPEAAFQLLQLDVVLKNMPLLRYDAEVALRHVEKIRGEREKLDPQVYAIWIFSLELLNQSDECEAVYSKWRASYPTDIEAQRGLGKLLAIRFERSVADPNANPDELADLLQQVSELCPESGWLAAQVYRLYQLRDSAIIRTTIPERTLAILLTDSQTSPELLEAIGASAVGASEWPRALGCFERLKVQHPDQANHWNNYAWVLMQADPTRLDEALAAVNKAIELSPESLRFRETRGQILVRLEQWQPAVDDLEYAMNGMPESTAIHASLAIAYDQLGERELASQHRRLAN